MPVFNVKEFEKEISSFCKYQLILQAEPDICYSLWLPSIQTPLLVFAETPPAPQRPTMLDVWRYVTKVFSISGPSPGLWKLVIQNSRDHTDSVLAQVATVMALRGSRDRHFVSLS